MHVLATVVAAIMPACGKSKTAAEWEAIRAEGVKAEGLLRELRAGLPKTLAAVAELVPAADHGPCPHAVPREGADDAQFILDRELVRREQALASVASGERIGFPPSMGHSLLRGATVLFPLFAPRVREEPRTNGLTFIPGHAAGTFVLIDLRTRQPVCGALVSAKSSDKKISHATGVDPDLAVKADLESNLRSAILAAKLVRIAPSGP